MKQHFKKTWPFVSKRFFGITGILFFALMAGTMNLAAQAYHLNQVIVLNDGNTLYSGGQHTRVGSYNPDTIAASFGSDVIIDSGFIYVGADSLLIKYDLTTKARVATQTIQGIREMAIWGNQILVTRGTTFPLHAYFQAYDKNTLNLIYQDTTVSHATQGIRVLNDSAYIAINDFGSGSIGNLGVVDLKAQREKREVNLGPSGLNPYDVEVEPNNQTIYTVNDLDYSNSTVTEYHAPAAFTNTSLHLSESCTGSAYYQGNIYFQAGNDLNVGLFKTSTQSVWDSLQIEKSIYGMGIDSADGYMYVGVTDYQTFGNVFIYNLFGQAIDSFPANISPESFAFDIRATTGVQQINATADLSVYPNPTSDEIHISFISASKEKGYLVLTDVLGREMNQWQVNAGSPATISLGNNLPNGVYFLKLETANGITVKKIIKQ
jgi:hypothetical protein